MRLVLALLFGLTAAAAAAQPAAPLPDSLDALAVRLHEAGFLSDSAYADLRNADPDDADPNAELGGRAGLLLVAAFSSAEPPRWDRIMGTHAVGDSSAFDFGALLPSTDSLRRMVERLAATGAISERTTRRLLEEATIWGAMGDSLHATIARYTDSGIVVGGSFPGLGLMAYGKAQLLMQAAQLTEREERLTPRRAGPFLDAATAAGILRPEERDRIVAALRAGEIDGPAEVLGYVGRARPFRMGSRSDDYTALLPRVLGDLAALLRESGAAEVTLGPTSVTFQTRVVRWTDDDSTVARNVTLAATIDGQRYETSVWADAEGDTLRHRFGDPQMQVLAGASELMNRALRDAGSPYRLRSYTPADPGEGLGTSLADAQPRALAAPPPSFVLALTREQAALFFNRRTRPSDAPRNPFLGFFGGGGYDDLDAPTEPDLTTARVREIVARVQALGVLDGVPPDSVALRGRWLEQRYVVHPHDVLDGLGLVLPFDWEMSGTPRPYEALLHELASISRGAFRPESIADGYGDDYDAERVPIAFTLGGRRFSADVEQQDDWYDAAIFRLVARALEETGTPGRFVWLDDARYDQSLVFLTPPQRQALEAEGWLVTVPDPE